MRRRFFIALAVTAILTSITTMWQQEDFVRDVLAPAGMPLVTGYHRMRSSPFLNTHLASCGDLESIGDFLLAPAQFLLGGKILEWDRTAHQFKERPRFRYDCYLLPKTIGATLVFLPSVTFGSLVKAVAYISDPHQALTDYATNNELSPNDLFYTHLGIPQLFGEEVAPCQDYPRHSEVSQQRAIEIEALKEVVHTLEAAKIPYWIDCGTALGAYRHGGFIPWDHDIDIAILERDHHNVKKLLRQLNPRRYEIQDWSAYGLPCTLLKLYIRETKTHLDIYHYHIDPQAKTLQYIFTYRDSPLPDHLKLEELEQADPVPYDWVFPLARAQFDGIEVWVPRQIEAYLTRKYRGNIDPAKIWSPVTETYERVEGHPYWATPHL